MVRIVVIDPDDELGIGFRAALERDGCEVEWADAPGALEIASDAELCVTTMAGALRNRGELPPSPRCPTLVLGDGTIDANDLGGFRLGYDEYLQWPCRTVVLHGRVDEMLARCGTPTVHGRTRSPMVRLATCSIDPRHGVVYRGSEVLQIRGREHAVLLALLRRDGRLAKRDELTSEIWGDRAANGGGRSLDNCVTSLRRKIEPDPKSPRYLLTVWRAGYRLVQSEPQPGAPSRSAIDHA